MELQYISDSSGKPTAVIVPIDEWNNITAKHDDSKELIPDKSILIKKASHYKGLLTNEEAEKFHAYVKQSRDEWERDI